MAKLPALVSAFATVDDRDRPAIDHYARTIREAGYLPTTKRGSGASEMTTRDAANLLIALSGADTPKDAPLAIDRFRSLRLDYTHPEAPLPVLQAVAEAETFGEALELLIDGAGQLAIAVEGFIVRAYDDRSDKVHDALIDQALKPGGTVAVAGLSIRFLRYAAEIALWTRQRGGSRREWEARFLADMCRLEVGFYGQGDHDRRVAVTVGLPTLLAAWRALNPDVGLESAAEDAAALVADKEPGC